jgi:hypothetical protein
LAAAADLKSAAASLKTTITWLNRVKTVLDDCDKPLKVFDQREIWRELRAAEAEFGGLVVDFTADRICVTTDEITLRHGDTEIELGAFQICFTWSDLKHPTACLSVEAMSPNPAAGNDGGTVHPHVRKKRVCLGDAAEPIVAAIEDGRLTDVFNIIDSLLHTYNHDSPYTKLTEWDGESEDSRASCASCGNDMFEDGCYCEGCENAVCDSCFVHCDICDDWRCDGCMPIRRCKSCKQYGCGDCVSACPNCGEWTCKECQAASDCSDDAGCQLCLIKCDSCDNEVLQDELTELGDENLCPPCLEEKKQELLAQLASSTATTVEQAG